MLIHLTSQKCCFKFNYADCITLLLWEFNYMGVVSHAESFVNSSACGAYVAKEGRKDLL